MRLVRDELAAEDRLASEAPMIDDELETSPDSSRAPADGPIDVIDADDAADAADDAVAENLPVIDLPSLEALLFSAHHPLTAGRIAELLDQPATKPVRAAVRALNEQYEKTDRAFRIEQVAGGYQLLTLPGFGDLLKKFHQKEGDAKLTKAALETLAIIAYKQPLLRVDVEAIRGVACGETIRSLMEKRLVKIAGRAEVPGRPILYGTTKRFLELFGLNNLTDLPQSEETKALTTRAPLPSPATPGDVTISSPSPGTAGEVTTSSPSPGTPGEGRGEGDFELQKRPVETEEASHTS